MAHVAVIPACQLGDGPDGVFDSLPEALAAIEEWFGPLPPQAEVWHLWHGKGRRSGEWLMKVRDSSRRVVARVSIATWEAA